jgi:hypothetical protein
MAVGPGTQAEIQASKVQDGTAACRIFIRLYKNRLEKTNYQPLFIYLPHQAPLYPFLFYGLEHFLNIKERFNASFSKTGDARNIGDIMDKKI